jgi:hypothetical protein
MMLRTTTDRADLYEGTITYTHECRGCLSLTLQRHTLGVLSNEG